MSTKGLGRGLAELGLDAILNETDVAHSLCQVPIHQIDPDPHQARMHIERLHQFGQPLKGKILTLHRNQQFV